MADGGGRKVTIFAGVYTAIQGALWSLLAVYCVCIYQCVFQYPFTNVTKDNDFYKLFYSSYLNGSSCEGAPIFQGLKHAADSSKRTYYWMMGYGVISALWIPVSILLLVPSVGRKSGVSAKCMYFPWIFITTIIVVSDVISAILYIMDITHTMSAKDYLGFIGASGSWENVTGMHLNEQDTAAPAVVMTLFSSRLFIFWLLNFALLFCVVKKCRSLSLHNEPETSSNSKDTDDADKYRSWERPIISQRQKEERLNQALYLDPEPRNWKGVALRRQTRLNNNGGSTDRSNYEQQILPKVTYKLDEFGIPIEEVRSPRAENYLDYGSEVPIVRPIREPSLLRRPSNRTAGQSMPPEELRGQVPWSYLRPPKNTSSSPSGIGPIIPAPDYGQTRYHKNYNHAATNKQ